MLANFLFGYQITQCLYVAAKLGIADYLVSGPKHINELAHSTECKVEPLYRVMRCLASLGIFAEQNNRTFTLTANAEELLSNSESTMKDFIVLTGEELYKTAGELLYSVKNGVPAFDYIYGTDHWSFLSKYPEKAKTFHDAMTKGSGPMIKEIISHYDFSPYRMIVDIGGGEGHVACEILSKYRHCGAVIYDLDNVRELATEYISKQQLLHRCKFVGGSFFNSVPCGDLFILKVVLHDWDDEHARVILKNCRAAIADNGRLLIIDKVLADTDNKQMVCLSDINMLVTLNGKERNLKEFQLLLKNTGFDYLKKIDNKTIFSIIEAKPKI